MLARDQQLSAEELLASARRRLAALEQLFRSAGLERHGQPFSGPSVPDFCLGVAEIVGDVIEMLEDVPNRAP